MVRTFLQFDGQQWNYVYGGATTVYGEDGGCNNYSPDIDSCDPEVALE